MSTVFTKRRPGAPEGFFAVEAAGLHWLAQAAAHGGVQVPVPLEVGADRIVLPRVDERAAFPAAADELGRRLAVTHAAGADHHGCPPDGWSGDGFIADLPLPHAPTPGSGWGRFYADLRVLPYARAAGVQDVPSLRSLLDRLRAEDQSLVGPPEPPARLHGDLWTGNVLWSDTGPVLIDPAAHGGHRETDLAMLALFGLPHLGRVLAAYEEVHPLADGWQDRVPVHQLHPVLVHAALFGPSYLATFRELMQRLPR
jgi:fructosamine-3-kinase